MPPRLVDPARGVTDPASAGGLPPLVGRDQELRAARDVHGRGSGRILWTGGPGTGKTLLLAHLARRAECAGARVLRCSGLGGAAGEVAGVVGALGAASSVPARPLVVLVDDLDLLEPDGRVELLEVLTRQPRPVALFATAKHPPDDDVRTFDVRPLEPLCAADAAAMLVTRGEKLVAPHVLAHLVGEVGGAPGAVLETVRLLSDDQCRGLAAIPDPVPVADSVRRQVRALLQELGSRDRTILLTAAVSVTRRTGVLLRALDTDVPGLLDSGAAEHITLVAGHFVVRDRRVRAVVHDEASLRERTCAHQRLAEAADALGEHVASDWHRALAALEGDPGLVGTLEATALALLARGEAGWAVRVAREALSHATPADRPAALALLGHAALQTDLLVDARDALQEALQDPGTAAGNAPVDLLVALTRLSGQVPAEASSSPNPAVRIVAAALHAGHENVTAARELLEAVGSSGGGPVGLEEACELARATVALAGGDPRPALAVDLRDAGEPVLAGIGTALTALALSTAGRTEEARAALAATMSDLRAARGRDPWGGLEIRGATTSTPWRGAQAFVRSCTTLSEVLVEVHAGDLARARALITEAVLEAPPDQGADGLAAVLAGRLAVLCDGQTDALSDAAAGLVVLPAPSRVRMELERTRALALLLSGEIRHAAGLLSLVEERTEGPYWVCLPTFSRAEVNALRRGGTGAGGHWAPVGPVGGGRCIDGLARAQLARQSLARGPWQGDAVRRLVADALAAISELDNPFEAGQTHLLVGRALHCVGRREEGIAHVMTAVDLFEGSGARAVARFAQSFLRPQMTRPVGAGIREGRRTAVAPSTGVRSPGDESPDARAAAPERHSPDPRVACVAAGWAQDLTPREVEVARAVGAGASNRAVARSLSLSVRTVEVHLTSIFRKVGASSRTELALLVMRGAGT